jgi:hypothetical protein
VVADSSILQEEIATEQTHLDRVYRRLAVAEEQARLLAAEGHGRARLGHSGGLVERDAIVHVAARRIQAIGREHEGLVFGRLDLVDGEVRYIGRLGVRDEDYEPLVLDWRAPAAAPFYRATAEHPMGVVRRRVIRCVGQRVVGVEDDLLDSAALPPGLPIIGDGALVAALSRARTGQMRDIVATIQHEQDAAIRAPGRGVTLISGGPGTGKTVVALHRAAYLLFADRRRFEGGGVLIVGPSPVFMRYIERVLPSLGEHSATLHAIGDIVDGAAATRRDDPESAAVKGSLRMRRVLSGALRESPPGAPDKLSMLYRGQLLRLGRPELDAARQAALARGAPYNRSRARAADELLDALWRQAGGASTGRAELTEQIRDRTEYQRFLSAWWPMLRPRTVLGWLADPARLARAGRGVLRRAEVSRLASGWAEAGDALSAHDVALLDELAVMLGQPPQPPRPPSLSELTGVTELSTVADRELAARAPVERRDDDFAHVIVDEAQDLSPMQWRMLGRRGRHASWTVVGDAAQSVWPDDAEAGQARDAALGRQARHAFLLSTNYRNPAEIFELAATVVRESAPDADLPRAVRRTGRPPRQMRTDDLAAALPAAAGELLAEVEGTVGVIVGRGRRSEVAGLVAGLAGPRLQVVDDFEAKGLEYDGVLVVEPAEILAEPRGARALYVALTRATQRLTVLGTRGVPLGPDQPDG